MTFANEQLLAGVIHTIEFPEFLRFVLDLFKVICYLFYHALRIQSPSQMVIGVIITSLERYLGSITILRRWLDP